MHCVIVYTTPLKMYKIYASSGYLDYKGKSSQENSFMKSSLLL